MKHEYPSLRFISVIFWSHKLLLRTRNSNLPKKDIWVRMKWGMMTTVTTSLLRAIVPLCVSSKITIYLGGYDTTNRVQFPQ